MFEILTGNRTRKNGKTVVRDNLVIPFEPESENNLTARIDSFRKRCSFEEKNLTGYSMRLLSALAKETEISQGAFFATEKVDMKKYLRFVSGFASPDSGNSDDILEFGEGFPGQVAKTGQLMNISDIPDDYVVIESGLGKSSSVSLLVFPVKYEDDVIAVLEVASFHRFLKEDEKYFNAISGIIAEQIIKLKTRN